MPLYVSFLKLTAEGNRQIANARERFELGRKSVEQQGGKIVSAYYIVSLAQYVIIAEFPSEEARVKSMVNSLQRGTVSYEVYRALPVEEFFDLVES